jgi:hypothetical protein
MLGLLVGVVTRRNGPGERSQRSSNESAAALRLIGRWLRLAESLGTG